MKEVIEKLAEIENKAQHIIENASSEKLQIEREMKKKRQEYQKELEKETLYLIFEHVLLKTTSIVGYTIASGLVFYSPSVFIFVMKSAYGNVSIHSQNTLHSGKRCVLLWK